MLTTKESVTGYGERKCIDPQAGDADLWKMWEALSLLVSKENFVEVEHVKARRTKKEKKEMSHFEKFVTDGNEKADELAKAGAILDQGFMAEMRAKTVTAGTRRGECGFAVRSQLALLGVRVERL